jgi:carotenoid phi-ring synthase / carotenoid chi-ring synthase
VVWLLIPVLFALLLFYGIEIGKWLVRRKLSDFRVEYVVPDPKLPETKPGLRAVAVLGGGVAGLTAALTLARRGYPVTLFEKNATLGGKLGSARVPIGSGREAWVSHGFHAFFPHYHNLNRFLDSLGLRNGFKSIGDYVILERRGRTTTFADVEPLPIFNLFSLLAKGMFSFADAVRAPGRDVYGVFLEYDAKKTFELYDRTSYAEFAKRGEVPPRLKIAFNTFARAFFASEEKLSLAQLVKAFHFYYLSHDGGLVYDYPTKDYQSGLMLPFEKEFLRLGGKLRLAESVSELEPLGEEFLVSGEKFGAVVCALDPAGLASVRKSSPRLSPRLQEVLAGARVGERYSVYRIWIDRDLRAGLPVFVITERERILDSVTAFHRFELETQAALQSGELHSDVRAVLELHSYSVPDDMEESQVRRLFLEELTRYFPELVGFRVLHESFSLKRDFTAFHVGLEADRPPVETGIRGFFCAGDWVKLPFPAMLLEAAASSGYLAANGILAEDGLRQVEVSSVPPRGLMADVPAPPARARILGQP